MFHSCEGAADGAVLVTGATGFVGYAVADRLCRDGARGVGLARAGARQGGGFEPEPGRPRVAGPLDGSPPKIGLPAGVARVVADLRDDAAVREAFTPRFDAVCHLAALVQARGSRADPVGYWRTDVGGTLAILQARAAQQGPPARLVVASTCAVCGEPGAARITEDVPSAPTNPYGSSKLAADRAVADLAATGAIGAVSLRAFNVAGGLPGHADRDETRLVPKAVAVVQGRALELVVNGDGGAVRDYVHVTDMADAFARALDACRPGHWTAYNVGSGRCSAIMDVVAAAEAVAGRALPGRHDPPAAEAAELLADASRIRRDLGWRPEASDLPRIVAGAYAAAE